MRPYLWLPLFRLGRLVVGLSARGWRSVRLTASLALLRRGRR